MSFVTTNPKALALAAGLLHDVAFIPTQFSAHGALYQLVGARATGVHERFIATLGTSADSYAATEAANTISAS
ncbi:hypothetical protein MSIMFI_04497 [Mycobacterium simulans]|uniref:PE family protein n=1 Tax=Mycobacterium simulans TaxID=627089 RepID=UPI0017482815|nr:PE family protein [Mycobacterium simulans]SON62967.1 hypothetical protein MSIMFI_04497 [Mycobacterium simulans]